MIKISVIVATRNRYQKLKRAIRSIEKQSLKDFEIIIVNDASTDETYDFLESIKNRNINIIHNKVSIGCAGARNKGIKEAKGEFLVFLDDDDEYLPKKLETHFNIMEKSKIDMSYSDMLRVCRDGSLYYWESPDLTSKKVYNVINQDFSGMSLAMQQIMIRKKVFEKVGLLDETNPNMEDVDFYLRIVDKCEIYHIQEPTVLYYDNGGVSENHYKTIVSRILLTQKYSDILLEKSERIVDQLQYIIYQIKLIVLSNTSIDIYNYIKFMQERDMKWLTTLRNGDKDLQSILFNLITVYKKLEAYNKSEFNKNVNLLIEDIKKYEDKKEKVKRRMYSSRDNQSVLEKLERMDDIFYFRFIDVIETDSIYTIRTCSSKSRLYFCSNASKKIEIELLILGFEECEIFGISHQIMIRKGEIKKIVIMRTVERGWNHLKILNDSICKRIAILDVKIVAN